MVVIMGWGDGRSQDLGPVVPATCPNCHNDVYMHEVKSDKQFSLYFIPLASYGGNEYLACPVCQHAAVIGPEHRATVAGMRAATASFRQGRVPEAYYRQTVEQFWRSMGVGPNGQQVVQAPRKVPAAATAAGPPERAAEPPATLGEQLKGLADLRDQGTLTEAEFSAAKKRLLEL